MDKQNPLFNQEHMHKVVIIEVIRSIKVIHTHTHTHIDTMMPIGVALTNPSIAPVAE